jgi:uncharacterized protein YdaU (DUF1376 family)
MSLSYFPMFADDFEADTAHLTLAEDGAYNRLLRLCWRTPGCSLPADQAWIYRKARALTDSDKATVDLILDEFFVIEKGRFHNPRLTKEWLAANDAHERRVKAGRKGGAAKSLKTNNSAPSNAKAKPKQPEPEPEPYAADKSAAAGARAQPQEKSDLVLEVMHAVGLSSGRIPTHWLPPSATIHCQKWITDLGLTQAEILAAAKASRQQHDAPPNGPKALDRVMQSIAKAKQSGKLSATAGRNYSPENSITQPRETKTQFDIPSQQFENELPPPDPKFAGGRG